MLPKAYRLPATIKLRAPQSISLPFFRIQVEENNLACSRFGFIVTKKIDKRAVIRNRLKRVLREAVKELLQTTKGYDVLFIVTKNFAHVSTKEIQEIIAKVFENLNFEN